MSVTPPAGEPARPDPWTLIVRTIALLLGLAILIGFVVLVWEILILLLFAGILAAGLRPVVQRVHAIALPPRGWHLPPVLIVLLIYVIVGTIFGLLGRLLIPPLAHEVADFATRLPQYVAQAQRDLAAFGAQYPWLPPIDTDIPALVRQLLAPLQAGLPNIFRFAVGIVDALVSVVLVLTIALYLVIEGAGIRRFALRLVPPERRTRVEAVADQILRKTGQWVLGQLALGFILFVATAIGLLVIGAPYVLLLAVLAGMLELVPMLGPIISAVIAVTITLLISPLLAVKVLILFIVLQQLENNILVPRVMSQTVGISPLTVLLALVLGGSLLGLAGAIVAVPVAAALQVLVQALLAEDGWAAPPRVPEE